MGSAGYRVGPKGFVALVAGLGALFAASAWAYEAEIVSLVGKGDVRPAGQGDWRPAAVRQQLASGAFVRTGDLSQMALLLADQTQLRLNQNSMVQIKEVAASGATSKLELSQGRVWAQAKRKVFAADPALPPAVIVQTPNATAAIRGTDWELVVDKNGTAVLTVLSGVVDFYNDRGRVAVQANEQARAEAGKAPTKILLTNARERVQWVTAYRPQPHRWLATIPGDLLPVVKAIDEMRYADALAALEAGDREAANDAAALLLADLYLALGRVAEAVDLLKRHASRPTAAALLARAYLIADRPDEAGRVLAQARATFPADKELLLAQGDLARFEGQAGEATAAYRRVLAGDPQSAEAWFGIGRIDAEREAVRDGRQALARAIALNPAGAGYQGELATLESYANEFAAAGNAFAKALEQQPDDYVALTGQGILRLKQGDADAALELFLQAGVIEPHYARGALYTGVAYYQLGNYPRAMEMFRKAAELDPQDPMPHMMMSLAAADRMEFGEAVAAARRAARLMPFLKSANQLLNDQKGNANIGASLAQFGLEDWAQAYAHDSYTPYWAGSHLFLADRYGGDFNKNSELFMGFLADPMVFGASNRFSTLIASPGNYATVGGRTVAEDTRDQGMTLTANGYSASSLPFSYFLAADPIRARPDWLDRRADGDNYTVGLGLRPSYETGLFFFGNDYGFDGGMRVAGSSPYDVTVSDRNRRADLGMSVKLSPTSQLWLKVGTGAEDSDFGGGMDDPALAMLSNVYLDIVLGKGPRCSAFVPGGCYASWVNFGRYVTKSEQDDLQLRHSFDVSSAWQMSWGLERGRQDKPFDILMNVAPLYGAILPVAVSVTGYDDVESTGAYASNQLRLSETALIQFDLFRMSLNEQNWSHTVFELPLVPGSGIGYRSRPVQRRDITEWNPSLGAAWKPLPGQTLRLAWQNWRRPASVSSLAPVDTVGIPVDDRLVALGGKLARLRAQYEWEVNAATFVQGSLDSKRVRNLNDSTSTPVSDFDLQDLQRLNSRNRLLPAASDYWEATPLFGAGEVDSASLAVNRVVAPNLSASLRYDYNHGVNTGGAFAGKLIPYLPRQLAAVGANWLPAPRWQLGMTATYRSRRYTDEANTQLLAAGWSFGLRSYWESVDKRWSFEAVADNLHTDKSAATTHSARLGAQALYRF